MLVNWEGGKKEDLRDTLTFEFFVFDFFMALAFLLCIYLSLSHLFFFSSLFIFGPVDSFFLSRLFPATNSFLSVFEHHFFRYRVPIFFFFCDINESV